MRILKIFALFLLFALASCGQNDGRLVISYKNFDKEIRIQQNLQFVFNKEVAINREFGVWLDEPYGVFTPSVKGKFKWISAKELVFSPDSAFAPHTDYQLQFTETLLQELNDPEVSLDASTHISFHTAYLRIERTDAFWEANAQGQSLLVAKLAFNYPVSPEQIRSLLTMHIGGQPVPYMVRTVENPNTFTLAMGSSTPDAWVGKALSIEIAPGVGLDAKHLAPLQGNANVPTYQKLEISGASTHFSGSQPYIEVLANQSLKEADLANFVSITPAVPFKIMAKPGGFVMQGGFASNVSYTVAIKQGLSSVLGKALDTDNSQQVIFGKPEPSIVFAEEQGTYLTSQGNRRVGVRIAGLEKVNVRIHKIYENNLLAFLSRFGSGSYAYYNGNYQAGRLGNTILETSLSVADLEEEGGLKLINLNFIDPNEFKGMYLLEVWHEDNRWLADYKLLTISDIGLLAKQGDNEIMVFANSIKTTEPLSGVNITLVSTNNQHVYTVTTNAQGVAKFTDLDKKAPGFKISAVMAMHGKEFNYMALEGHEVNRYKFDTDGLQNRDIKMQTFIYGDRKLYRPGEKMYVKALVRGKTWEIPSPRPMNLELLSPRNAKIATQRLMLSAQGSLETSFDIPADAPTGSYEWVLKSANGDRIGVYEFSVEEFMPQRIKVALRTDTAFLKPTDTIKAHIEAYNLFGTPAGNRRYDVSINVSPAIFSPKGYESYDFALEGLRSYYEGKYVDGTTDAQGKATVSHYLLEETKPNALPQLDGDLRNEGLLDVSIYATVFDENGRPVNRSRSVKIATQNTFLGIGEFDRYAATKQYIRIPLAAVDVRGKPVNNLPCQVQVIRYDWNNVVERDPNSGTFKYQSKRQEVLVADETIKVSSNQSAYSFIPDRSGEYEVRVRHPKAATYVKVAFYTYSQGSTTTASFGIDKEGMIAMTADKAEYRIGETAKILVKMPFAGKMMFSIEKDRVLELREFKDYERVVEMEVHITEAMLPNAYASAVAIKPITNTDIPLTVAYGYLPIKVVREESKLQVSLEMPERSHANKKQQVKIRTGVQGAEITVAMVDEGILQIKNYESPNPFDYFYQRRALGVDAYSIYANLLSEFQLQKQAFGAGEMLGNRANPLSNRRVKSLAIWSGTLYTDAKGEAKFNFDLPQFSGKVRVVAVAVKGASFGMAEGFMTVADPIVVSTGLPRFASIGDELEVPVMLANTENTAKDVSVSISGGDLLLAVGEKTATVSIPANSEKFVFFKLKVGNGTGLAQVKVTASANGQNFVQNTDLPIGVGSGLVKQHGYGTADAGKSVRLLVGKDLLGSTGKAKLVVGKSPLTEMGHLLSGLIDYPHGCLEQTISKAFPQLYIAELLPYTTDTADPKEATYYVNQAIGKLSAMQRYDGGMSYWPGGNEGSLFGTAYAAHFLLEAQNAGFQPPQEIIDKCLRYLDNQLSGSVNLVKYVFLNAQQQRIETDILSKEYVYAMYVMALAGKPPVAQMNILKQRPDILALDSRYMLACTYLLAGDERSYLQLLPEKFAGERSERNLGGSFSSPIRDQAFVLHALMAAAPDNEQIGIIAKQLSQELRNAEYISTQDAAFALISLGKLAKQVAASQAEASVWVDGKMLGQGATVELGKELLGKTVEIRAKGGKVYYFWEAEGLSATGKVKEEDKRLKVRRAFYTRDGEALKTNKVKLGDLIVVKISLELAQGSFAPGKGKKPVVERQEASNIVVSDMLPAGLEIENPRLVGQSNIPRIGNQSEISWIKDASMPDYSDFRDDRVNFFADAKPEPQHFYYLVRAVSKGKYRLGPISADAMYSGEYYSYHGAGSFEVE